MVKNKILEGISGNPGSVKGSVKIIQDPEESSKIEDGDILVTEVTTPLFTPIILKASAVVTDRGGKLCHAAILARELDIPCIVGTKRATEKLEDGMEVIVDGKDGKIYG